MERTTLQNNAEFDYLKKTLDNPPWKAPTSYPCIVIYDKSFVEDNMSYEIIYPRDFDEKAGEESVPISVACSLRAIVKDGKIVRMELELDDMAIEDDVIHHCVPVPSRAAVELVESAILEDTLPKIPAPSANAAASGLALENPVRIRQMGSKWIVENEGGATLASGSKKECKEWCRKNNCAPIPRTWAKFNRNGYEK